MIDMHSKYDNMYKNGMFYALICINNHIIACYQDLAHVILPLGYQCVQDGLYLLLIQGVMSILNTDKMNACGH